MDNQQLKTSEEKTINLYNKAYSENYRAYDEHFINEPSYPHFGGIIRKVSASFGKPISVLEVGCGTGRYFHTLQNTAHLTGIDISEHMLELARHPLKENEVNIPDIRLIAGSVYEHDFGNQQFDFIYCIGVLGEHVPLTDAMLSKLYKLLNDKGILFTTVVNLDARKNIKRKLAEAAYPMMPQRVKQVLDERWKSNYLTLQQLKALMTTSPFTNYDIENYTSEDKGWKGGHYEVTARK